MLTDQNLGEPEAEHDPVEDERARADHVDPAAVLSDLGLEQSLVTPERWQSALSSAVGARSRQQVARAVDRSLRRDSGDAANRSVD